MLLGPRATAQPINIFYSRSSILRTTNDNIKEKLEKETLVARYENLDLDSGARQVVRCQQKNKELNLEPMLDYKSPNIASRATPIGSAERAPDRDEDNQYWRCGRISI
jgi:hypothetical protein